MKKKTLCSIVLCVFIMMFFISQVNANTSNESTSETIRIQAKLFFGDYEDTSDKNYDDMGSGVYKYQTYFQLRSTTDNSKIGDVVPGKFVVNDETGSREDWCYQFKAEWDVPKNTAKNGGYYIELVNKDGTRIKNGAITLNNRTFDVYYLKDDIFGHPGEDADAAGHDGKIYPTLASEVNRNDDGDIYIYLDPREDLDGNQDKINITVKKRWDSHNEKNINLHANEKIIVQLQRWDAQKGWLEFNSENFTKENVEDYQNTKLFPSQTYEYANYLEVSDVNGGKHFVSCNVLDDKYPKTSNGGDDYYTYSQGQRIIYEEVLDNGTVKYWGKKENGQFKNEIDPKLFEYNYLSNPNNNPYNKKYIDPDRNYRLWINSDLDEVKLNNVVA